MDGLHLLARLVLIPNLKTCDEWPDETTIQSMENDIICDMDECTLTNQVQQYIRNLISALKSAHQSHLDYQAQHNELGTQMEAKDELVKRLRRQKRKLQNRVNELKSHIRILRTDGDAVHDMEIATYQNEVNALHPEVQYLSKQLGEHETEMIDVLEERVDLKWRLYSYMARIEDLKQENEEMWEENNELQYHIDAHDIETV